MSNAFRAKLVLNHYKNQTTRGHSHGEMGGNGRGDLEATDIKPWGLCLETVFQLR